MTTENDTIQSLIDYCIEKKVGRKDFHIVRDDWNAEHGRGRDVWFTRMGNEDHKNGALDSTFCYEFEGRGQTLLEALQSLKTELDIWEGDVKNRYNRMNITWNDPGNDFTVSRLSDAIIDGSRIQTLSVGSPNDYIYHDPGTPIRGSFDYINNVPVVRNFDTIPLGPWTGGVTPIEGVSENPSVEIRYPEPYFQEINEVVRDLTAVREFYHNTVGEPPNEEAQATETDAEGTGSSLATGNVSVG